MTSTTTTFERIFSAELEFVVRSLLRLGVADRDVEDVAQQVFLVVHGRLAEYDPSRPIRAWLWGIARRAASDYRALARHRMVLDDGTAAERAQAEGSADQLSTRQLVHRALDQIEAGRREVLILYEMEGFTLAEIAELTGAPLNTVASRLRKAREELAAAVRGLEGGRS